MVVSSRKAGCLRGGARRVREAGLRGRWRRPCNVSRKEELQALVDATVAKWGRIDIVVANAASNPYYGPLTGIADDAFDKIVTNNLKSVLWLAAHDAARHGAARGGGSFIVVGSIGGIKANTVIGAYGMSKAADHHLVRNLAAEWGPKNVRVNAIAPGPGEDRVRPRAVGGRGARRASALQTRRCAASASRATSAASRCSWPPTPRPSSPDR